MTPGHELLNFLVAVETPRHHTIGMDSDHWTRVVDHFGPTADLDTAGTPRIDAGEVVHHDGGPAAALHVAVLLGLFDDWVHVNHMTVDDDDPATTILDANEHAQLCGRPPWRKGQGERGEYAHKSPVSHCRPCCRNRGRLWVGRDNDNENLAGNGHPRVDDDRFDGLPDAVHVVDDRFCGRSIDGSRDDVGTGHPGPGNRGACHAALSDLASRNPTGSDNAARNATPSDVAASVQRVVPSSEQQRYVLRAGRVLPGVGSRGQRRCRRRQEHHL